LPKSPLPNKLGSHHLGKKGKDPQKKFRLPRPFYPKKPFLPRPGQSIQNKWLRIILLGNRKIQFFGPNKKKGLPVLVAPKPGPFKPSLKNLKALGKNVGSKKFNRS